MEAGTRNGGAALRAALNRWRAGQGGLPTTPAGVEQCAVTVFLGVRAVNLVQLAVALPASVEETTRPALFWAVLAGYLAESAAVATVAVRTGAYRDPRWGWADTGTAALVLLVQPAFVAPEDATGSWTAWGFACTLSTAVGAAVVFSRRRHIALAVAVLAGCYLAATLPHAQHDTVVGNAFAYVGFAVLTRLLAGYLRRLAADADEARRAAARAAAEQARLEELQRQRVLLHDNISVLRLLAGPDLPPGLEGPLRAQAETLANRVRAFLDDAADRIVEVPDGRPLVAVVRDAVTEYPDLPVEASLDLAEGAVLPEAAAEALRDAVRTLLANVRIHAHASAVVVHADADPVEDEWEVTVNDDGRGFDPATTPQGFGLRVQVEQALAAHGISAHVHSVPGDGTRVTLRGRLGS